MAILRERIAADGWRLEPDDAYVDEGYSGSFLVRPALERLRDAFGRAGMTDIRFELEPVAAAYHYESGLDRDETVLIADFGGGTSDFCLLRVGPKARARAEAGEDRAGDILGVGGVGIAGDSFDSRIVEHCVTPHLGRGTRYRAMDGQMLPMPVWQGVYRRRHTAPQSERSAEQRRDNLFDAFGTRLSPPTRLTVVDDVMTTGSTVMEIAETLRLAGARDVRAWVCARVP